MEVLATQPAAAHAAAAGLSGLRLAEGAPSCGEGSSLASCGSEAEAAPRGACAAPEVRTHHLLKHCLTQGQREASLQHFHTNDAREAAKEIARMGQRELQAKFREVYGSATKSNNNSWLRRKLYEAVGVAPLKAATKGKARKAGAGAQRKPAAKARSPKVAAVKVKREAGAAPRHSSPQWGGGMSILDAHAHSGLLSGETSDSDDCASHGTHPAPRHHSAPATPRSPLGLAFAPHGGFGGAVAAPPPPGFVPVAEPQSPLGAGLHWAEGFGAMQQQPCGAPPPPAFASAASAALPPLPGAPAALGCGGLGAPTPFKPMDLEQDAASLWGGGCGELQAWYFGSMELGMGAAPGLGAPGLGAALGAPMQCGSSDATGTVCAAGDDDDVPLLTLDLGGIDVTF